ncbi:hypothetical protein [Streptomyces sp. NPDC048172]|uniref:hypothetical protein n=1 Tax=Streptomyces sp. NPDC048172 TaxID=3365505 RepID=UPI00371AB93F
MGAVRRELRARRIWRLAGAAGAVTAVVLGTAACEPGDAGGLSTASVALATDQAGTAALEHAGIKVQWMSCTAHMGTRPGTGTATATRSAKGNEVARVECEGETTNRKKLAIKGRVTEEQGGRCVRGDLVATSGDRTLFRASVLGDCDAKPSGTTTAPPRPTTTRPTDRPTEPTDRPTVTETVDPPPTSTPTPSEPTEKPPVTVTVTGKPTPTSSPTCGCDEDGNGGDPTPEHEPAGADR